MGHKSRSPRGQEGTSKPQSLKTRNETSLRHAFGAIFWVFRPRGSDIAIQANLEDAALRGIKAAGVPQDAELGAGTARAPVSDEEFSLWEIIKGMLLLTKLDRSIPLMMNPFLDLPPFI